MITEEYRNFCRFSKKLNKIDVKDTNVIGVEQKCKNRKILCFKILNFSCNCDNLKVNFLNDISRKIRGGEQNQIVGKPVEKQGHKAKGLRS